ncbi:hypothetical protein [Acidisoma silvae]|uniref:Uncharacterized protein n=1 Tax=Acidisoma silvae TaxID=2802396 RepID=A0A964E112_9PROT|nr:hypothetical protein [Acidisoma silvae]MCB8878100.1 hypothetical protein [Acidisoma silvae]
MALKDPLGPSLPGPKQLLAFDNGTPRQCLDFVTPPEVVSTVTHFEQKPTMTESHRQICPGKRLGQG